MDARRFSWGALWRSLQERLARAPASAEAPLSRYIAFNETHFRWLRAVAQEQQRPEADVAADLLRYAIQKRWAILDTLRRWESLSVREQEVVNLICQRFTNRQIASRLGISPETVKVHVRNILVKFNLHSKGELRLLLNGWESGRAACPWMR